MFVSPSGYQTHTRGLSFVELIVVIAIISIFAVIATATMGNIYRDAGLRAGSETVRSALRDARAQTLGATGDVVYGVRVASTSVTSFMGSTYVAGHASNTVYEFDAGTYATGTLVTTGTPIIFRRLTGFPSATGTVLVHDRDGGRTATVTILGTGLVE